MNLQELIGSNNSILGYFEEFVYGKICEREQVECEFSQIVKTESRVECRGNLFQIDLNHKTVKNISRLLRQKNTQGRTKVFATTCLSKD